MRSSRVSRRNIRCPRIFTTKLSPRSKILESTISKKSVDAESARARIAELEAKLEDSVPKEKYSRLMDQISGLVSLTGEFSALPEAQLDHHEVPGEVPLNTFPQATETSPGIVATELPVSEK